MHHITIFKITEFVIGKYICFICLCLVCSQDVFMTCGTHGGLELCVRVLCEPGSTLLVPRPCYPFYQYQGDGMGLNLKYYNLLVMP